MATLVLRAVGSAIAGPIGGAVGAIAGQLLDQRVFAPKARQGPRLSDLAVQSSTYGEPLPRVFGRMRVAGTVIWSTDLKESRTRVSQGKGRAKVDQYSYSASFAVALSARRVARVERIWADGKLLRGAAGDWKYAAAMRLHMGEADQPIDPTIAAYEGPGGTPAYRGLAYAVFTDLPLADFGNRLPALQFEVIADEKPVSAGAILSELADGRLDAAGGLALDGFAASSLDFGGTALALGRLDPLTFEPGARPRVRFGNGGEVTIGEVPLERPRRSRKAAEALPGRMTLRYADPARDYQPGLQDAQRLGERGQQLDLELPAALSGQAAKQLVAAALSRSWSERTELKLALPWRMLGLAPGDLLTLADGSRWRAERVALEGYAVQVDAVAAGRAATGVVRASSGRSVAQADVPRGPTRLALIDLPQLSDVPASEPQLAVLAGGTTPAWRPVGVLASGDGGATYQELGASAQPAVLGMTATALPPAAAVLIDRASAVEIVLADESEQLVDADESVLTSGGNAILIGDELLQYGRAEPLGRGRWRLRDLWRGRRGTEAAAMAGTLAGAPVAVPTPDAILPLPRALVNGPCTVLASGLGDSVPVTARSEGAAMRAVQPLAPVHLRAVADAGGWRISWIRRSRDGYRWRDELDVPVGEERLAFRVRVLAGPSTRSVEVVGQDWFYDPAQIAADRATGVAVVRVDVAQIGTFALSPAAAIDVTIKEQ